MAYQRAITSRTWYATAASASAAKALIDAALAAETARLDLGTWTCATAADGATWLVTTTTNVIAAADMLYMIGVIDRAQNDATVAASLMKSARAANP